MRMRIYSDLQARRRSESEEAAGDFGGFYEGITAPERPADP